MSDTSEYCGEEPYEMAICPACGEPIDYCQGHGELGDPEGHAYLQYVQACEEENLDFHGLTMWNALGRPKGPLG